MGFTTVKLIETPQERSELMKHILNDLEALEYMLEKDLFEKDKVRIGAEQELNFVNSFLRPAPIGLKVLEKLDKSFYTTEYALFNFEANLEPLELQGKALSDLDANIQKHLKIIEAAAAEHDARLILTGILPTIRKNDVSLQSLTPQPRYQALLNAVLRERGTHYEYHIEGVDDLISRDNPTVFGGTMTSFQIHLQLDPEHIVEKYNWAQCIAAPLLACATNSPLFLGKRLWRETRIALFRQTTDTRRPYHNLRDEDARVSFGRHWQEKPITEIFKNDIASYTAFLTTPCNENSLEKIKNGEIPRLDALNFFNGTIYRWNRVCYGNMDGKPHLRIENRVLPAGPTVKDQVANSAFWIGMMEGMPEEYLELPKLMNFRDAKENFYKAARDGLDCQFNWTNKGMITARDLILEELLPIARKGLQKRKVNSTDIDQYLGIIEERTKSGKTGSQWILDSFNSISEKATQYEALIATTAAMIEQQNSEVPVHKWSIAELKDGGDIKERYSRIGRIMNNTYYTVKEDDVIELAANIMKWKNIGNIPVEGKKGELVGLINKDAIITYLTQNISGNEQMVRDIMITDLITAPTDTPLLEALELMQKHDITCLPVIENGRLVGLISEKDFLGITRNLLKQLTQ